VPSRLAKKTWRLSLGARHGLGIAAVVEAVAAPGDLREAHPAQRVADEHAPFHVHHLDLVPVGARDRGHLAGRVATVSAERERSEREGAVERPGVRIEDGFGHAVQPVLDVEHRLVAQALVEEEEDFLALAERRAVLRVVGQGADAFARGSAKRDAVEMGEGLPVLRRDPAGGRFRLVVLEPAVGIGDARAEVVVDVIDRRIQGHGGNGRRPRARSHVM
jgi:hypothetical protein